MKNYQNPALSPQERAKDLLSRLSLEEKMAQVQCFMLGHADPGEALQHGIGHVSTLEIRNVKTLDEVAEILTRIQKQVMESSEHGIPAIFHMEGLCGALMQEAASFPSGIGRASTWNPELEERIGGVVGRQERAVGITQTLAPVLDISRDSRMGRQCETYGEDPTLAAAMGSAYAKGVQGQSAGRRTDACAKHFLAFHNSQGAIHGANVEIGERQLQEIYGKPFQAAIVESNLRGIMPCYCSLNGKPVSASGRMLTGLLREDMGFDGVVMADYSAIANVHQVQHLYESPEDAGLACMEAGMDIELPNVSCYNQKLEERFREGSADMAVLDRAVYRVLCAKFRMGLFENPFSLTGEALWNEVHGQGDSETALQSARESMVLLKNKGNVLPLDIKGKKIALIGCHGKNARFFFGGYTHLSMVEAIHAAANSLAGVDAANAPGAESAGRESRTMEEGHSMEERHSMEEHSMGEKDSVVNFGDRRYKMKTVPGTQIQDDEAEEFDNVLRQLHPHCKSLLEELQARIPEVVYAYGYPKAGSDTSHFGEALEIAAEADILILTLGGKNGSGSIASMGEGVDGTDINLPPCQEAFIREAAKLGKPMVGVHMDGRPVSGDAADRYLDALLEAWNPSEKGAQAIVDVLTGAYNPGGKLPLSVARCAGQAPLYYNHPNGSAWHQGESIGFAEYVDMPHTPRYHFGYGLSYTDFAYSDLQIWAAGDDEAGTRNPSENGKTTGAVSAGKGEAGACNSPGDGETTDAAAAGNGKAAGAVPPERFRSKGDEAFCPGGIGVSPNESVCIRMTLRNTGSVAGDEVVQLYVRDCYATMARPVKELAGFRRVHLEPGESKAVTFTMKASQMAFLDDDMRWKTEKGQMEVQLGSSSEDIRLTGFYTVTRDGYTDSPGRGFYAGTEVD